MSLAVCQSSDFETSIAKETLTLVDFSATWCGPCKDIAPQFEKLKSEYPKMDFIKIDVDECDELSSKYRVTAVPTFLLFQNGQVVDSYTGASINSIKTMLKHHLSKPTRTSSGSHSKTHPTRTSSKKCACGEDH